MALNSWYLQRSKDLGSRYTTLLVVVTAPTVTAAWGAAPSAVEVAGVDGVGRAPRPASRRILPPVAAPVLTIVAPHLLSGATRRAVVFT
jgi:hypothetical protein